MAKTIKEMMQKAFWETDISDHPAKAFEQGYEKSANDVLKAIEEELPKSDKQLNDYGKALLWRINKRIKVLKGE